MSHEGDPALVYLDETRLAEAGTHVLIVGVGKYAYGAGPRANDVAGDLLQLSSPPISARGIADWFIEHFQNPERPLASVSLLTSEDVATPYVPFARPGSIPCTPPAATLANVKQAASAWVARLNAHAENMAVFYFCGHGVSHGHRSVLLLEDFGDPAAAFDGAIDFEVLRATMKNAKARRQLYLLDCCRTASDQLFQNEDTIGTRIVSVSRAAGEKAVKTESCVIFPTLEGDRAYGVRDAISPFARALIDAMTFAAAEPSNGPWQTTTGRILDEVRKLLRHQVPELKELSTPQGLDVSSFDFNVVARPSHARSLVTISDQRHWGDVELACTDTNGTGASHRQHTRDIEHERCCRFDLPEGTWRFTGALPTTPPSITSTDQYVRPPVAYVNLEVEE